jgi:hypothetical protein
MLSDRKLESLLRTIASGYWDDYADDAVWTHLLFNLGFYHISGLSGGMDYYGNPQGVKPPREEGGALPGLGNASGFMTNTYVDASCAWMHANCDEDPKSREFWRKELERLRGA